MESQPQNPKFRINPENFHPYDIHLIEMIPASIQNILFHSEIRHLAGLKLRVCNRKIIFFFLIQNICLNETVLLSTQNRCLILKVRKYLQFYTENFCLSKPEIPHPLPCRTENDCLTNTYTLDGQITSTLFKSDHSPSCSVKKSSYIAVSTSTYLNIV